MSETDTTASAPDSGTTGSAAVSSSPSSPSSSDTGASTDSRSIAASLLSGDTERAAPAPQAADPSASPSTPAAATSGGDDDAEYQQLLASGSMPVDRHKAVLTNARNKTRAEVEQEYRAKYGWADSFDRQRAEQALGLLQALDKNPEHALRTLASALGVNFAPPPPPQAPEGPPAPDVRLDDGSEFYSAKQLQKLHEWKDAQYEQKLQRLEQRYQPLVEERAMTRMREEAQAEAGTTLAECRSSWPSFTALETDIKQRMVADPKLSLERAYIQAFAAKGLPAIQAAHQTDRESQLSRKAAASAAPPSAPRAVTPLRDRDRSTTDIAREAVLAAGLQ